MTTSRHWLSSRLVVPSSGAVWFVEGDAEDALAEVASTGVTVHRAELPEPVTKDVVFTAVAKALRFPDYFGHNWDALDECLRDLSWLDPGGVVLVVGASQAAWLSSPAVLGGLISCWLLAADAWLAEARAFHLVFRR